MTQKAHYRKWLRDMLSSRMPKASLRQASRYGIFSAHTFQLQTDDPYITLYDKHEMLDHAKVTFGKNLKPVDIWILTHLAGDFEFNRLSALPEGENWRQKYQLQVFEIDTKIGSFAITIPLLQNTDVFTSSRAWLRDVDGLDQRFVDILFDMPLVDSFVRDINLYVVTEKFESWTDYVNYYELRVPDKFTVNEAFDALRDAYNAQRDRDIRELKVQLIEQQAHKFDKADYYVKASTVSPAKQQASLTAKDPNYGFGGGYE